MELALDKSALKIKNLEDENLKLKKRLDVKTEECMKIWERDLYISCMIQGILNEKKIDSKTAEKLQEIDKILENPMSFKPGIHLECEQQIEILQNSIIVLENCVEQAKEEVKIHQSYTKYLEANMEQLKKQYDVDHQVMEGKINRLKATISELEQKNEEYEKKHLELIVKIDKLSDENFVRRTQIAKLDQKLLQPSQDENVKKDELIKGWSEKEQNYLTKLAKFEGSLLNKDKELKRVYEQLETYRNMLKM